MNLRISVIKLIITLISQGSYEHIKSPVYFLVNAVGINGYRRINTR